MITKSIAADSSTIEPWGDISWAKAPEDPDASTRQSESRSRRNKAINKFISSYEAEESEFHSRMARLFDLLADAPFFQSKFETSIMLPITLQLSKSFERLDSSTLPFESIDNLNRSIEYLFRIARGEFFEDGVLTDFSKDLIRYIYVYGDRAVEIVANLVVGEYVDSEVVSEALRWIGRIKDPRTHKSRFLLLARSLNSSAARVRDGALLGLASMDDPSALVYLEQAFEREPIGQLRQNLKQVIDQLIETQAETLG